MIRQIIYRLNDWYNTRGSWTQAGLLFGFCIVFLAMLWLATRYNTFDTKAFRTTLPVHIGQSSGPSLKDTITPQKK